MKIDGYSKHTHSHILTRACTSTHPPTPPPLPPTHTHTLTHKIWERRVKVGFDRHTFYKTRDYNISNGGFLNWQTVWGYLTSTVPLKV